MLRTRVYLILIISVLTGCVTVKEEQNKPEFDNIQAAESRISLGLGYLKAGEWQQGRQNIELALKHAPTYYRSLLTYAYLLQKTGDIKLAEKQYKKALRYSPKNGDVQNNYGVFLCRYKRYDEAQAAFAKAIAQPYYYKTSGSYENAALCAMKAGDVAKAKEMFDKALKHEPNRVVSTLQLVRLELKDGEYNQARSRLFYFHKRYGYRADSLYLTIKLESAQDRLLEVEKYAKVLASQYPESKEYRLYLANEY
ncbi:type IV pilus biogenesis/stability protein PilW [Veronia pacifica]|uniref:Type IV pilus biogenesis/stability protein PilW n=1 Tax=Veronia pacifica TaxID=1080227 RepID=A0A1C3EGE6_9GAMM|nr:type IV pilus biogenesis/stability protein PilW [Veronia pacifica]ODA32317.1 type IV pilus biogenesis/stability protein PilW [Veronia pacifica]